MAGHNSRRFAGNDCPVARETSAGAGRLAESTRRKEMKVFLQVAKASIMAALEYEKEILNFKAICIDPPPIEEVRQLAASTGLTMARAANRIYYQRLRGE